MKKALALLLALTVVGFVFAQDAEAPAAQQPKYSVTGDATLAWAYNIDDAIHGFTNSYNVTVIYNLLDNASATKGGEGLYGQIDITKLSLRVKTTATGVEPPIWSAKNEDGDNFGIEAKIVSGPLSIGVYGAPGCDYENAVFVPLFSSDAGYANGSAIETKLSTYAGTYVKYDFGAMGNVKVSIANNYETAAVPAVVAVAAVPATTETVWIGTGTEVDVEGTEYYAATDALLATPLVPPLTAGTVYRKVVTGTAVAAVAAADAIPGSDPYYLGGIDLTLNPIADVLAINAGLWYDPTLETLVATAKVAVTAGALSAYGAADIMNAADLSFDVSGNVAYSLNEKKDTVSLDVYYQETANQGDFGLKFVDAEGFVPGLAFTVGVFGEDMLQDHDPLLLSVAQSLSYSIGETKIKPYEALRYDLSGELMYLNLGVEYGAITNTTIKADFAMGTTADDSNFVLVGADVPMVITLSAKVTL